MNVDLLQVGKQVLAIATLQLDRIHRMVHERLFISGSTEALVGHKRFPESISKMVCLAQKIPRKRIGCRALRASLQVRYGRFLIGTRMQRANTVAEVEVEILLVVPKQILVSGIGLCIFAFGKQRIGLRTLFLASTLGP